MSKIVYLSIACDADPDVNPCYRKISSKEKYEHIWYGIVQGICNFRQLLNKTYFISKYGSLPITWLLRSDRQIYELYGNPSFCFLQFEKIWRAEYKYKSEIGWHPHLYCWDEQVCKWIPHLTKDDDLEMLAECLDSLRKYASIYSVRTGWDYCSNRLMGFFDKEGLIVDASAIPGCVQSGMWFYDWSGTPRLPYYPSKFDYRVPTEFSEERLRILELPVLVRVLNLPLHFIRFLLRNMKIFLDSNVNFTDWESARWQGMVITKECKQFYRAVGQTVTTFFGKDDIFLTTYFHTNEFLSMELTKRFIQNLEDLLFFTEQLGYELIPTTLTTAASLAKQCNLAI